MFVDTRFHVNCVAKDVKIRRLDDYWEHVLQKEQVFLLKIDVYGFEDFVIQGGIRMFEQSPPLFILLEFSPFRAKEYNVDAKQILKDLIGFGYRIKSIHDNSEISPKNTDAWDALFESTTSISLHLKHLVSLGKYVKGEISF